MEDGKINSGSFQQGDAFCFVLFALKKSETAFFKGNQEMKTLEQIFTFQNLLKAHKQCRKQKQHKRETIFFELNLASNLVEIQRQMKKGSYKIGKYKLFYVYDPKKRKIECLPYRDRVTLMCLCRQCLEPFFEKRLIYDNGACRNQKGTFFAVERLKKFLQSFYRNNGNNGWVLKCDISKYFESINHTVLKNMLKKQPFSPDVQKFLEKLIDSHNLATDTGLPIGNQTSQWFSLFYLDPLDRFIKEHLKTKNYVRYMDDFVLIHHSKQHLKSCWQQITTFLQNYKLTLNHKTQLIPLKQGFDFCGFNFKFQGTKLVQKLRQSAKQKMYRKLKRLPAYEKFFDGEKFIKTRLASYRGHVKGTVSADYLKQLEQKYYKGKIERKRKEYLENKKKGIKKQKKPVFWVETFSEIF